MKKFVSSLAVAALMAASANAGLNTVTYVDASGGVANNAGNIPSGTVVGDHTGVGEVTLNDVDGGDMWNGGDQFIYLHDSAQEAGDFTATVRVVSQTAAVDGRWGKAGIRASSTLDGNSANAMSQIAAGNGSQADLLGNAPADQHNPVPMRLAGRRQNDGQGGFENPIIGAAGTEQRLDGDGNVANDALRADGVNMTWLSLSYNSSDNSFVAGSAADVGGAPGVWSYSDPETGVPTDGDWYVGLAYSVHGDFDLPADGMHGVTFDNYSIVPEPSSLGLLVLGGLGLLGVRRRR